MHGVHAVVVHALVHVADQAVGASDIPALHALPIHDRNQHERIHGRLLAQLQGRQLRPLAQLQGLQLRPQGRHRHALQHRIDHRHNRGHLQEQDLLRHDLQTIGHHRDRVVEEITQLK